MQTSRPEIDFTALQQLLPDLALQPGSIKVDSPHVAANAEAQMDAFCADSGDAWLWTAENPAIIVADRAPLPAPHTSLHGLAFAQHFPLGGEKNSATVPDTSRRLQRGQSGKFSTHTLRYAAQAPGVVVTWILASTAGRTLHYQVGYEMVDAAGLSELRPTNYRFTGFNL